MAQSDAAKRANTMITIAQLKFKQTLKTDDHEARLPPVTVEACSQFFNDLDAVLKKNTRVNIQKCTEWIIRHMTTSKTRTSVLGSYLVSISKAMTMGQQDAASTAKPARNRINLLLIISDVLHTDTFHSRSITKQSIFSKECAPFAAEIIAHTGACCLEKDSPTEQKLKALLNYWTLNRHLSAEDIKICRDRADESLLLAQGGTLVRKRDDLLPEYHGDRNAPWHELPAAHMLEHMIKEPKRPIDHSRIKIAKLDKKPISPHVRKLLDNYLENIDLKYKPTADNPKGETDKYKLWLDLLGQTIKQDKETGEIATVCNGYGWSLKFCQDMQEHGVPQNIKVLREDLARMEKVSESQETPQRPYNDKRVDDSPRRHWQSSPESSPRRDRSRNRRGSASSYDSNYSRSQSRSREQSHQHYRSSKDRDRSFHEGGRAHNNRGANQARQAHRSYGRDSSQSTARWNGSNVPPSNGPSSRNFVPPPPPGYGQGLSQPPQPPFLDHGYPPPPPPPPPPVPGMFSGQFMPSGFMPPPPPAQVQSHGGFSAVPPPPPPHFKGSYPAPPIPNIPVQPNMPLQNNQYGNQYGNQGGNQHGNQGGNQYGNQSRSQYGNQNGNHSNYGDNASHGQNQRGFQDGRGGYRGNSQSGGGYHNSHRGGYSSNQRGQRGGRY